MAVNGAKAFAAFRRVRIYAHCRLTPAELWRDVGQNAVDHVRTIIHAKLIRDGQ